MIMEKMFEMAIRNKFRFVFKGVISVEDLWDLKVESLDEIYKNLVESKKKANEESLLQAKTKGQEELECKIEIVKHIVSTKLEEMNAKQQEKVNKEKKQRILSILNEKENQDLQGKSIEELKAMLNDLD